MDGFGIQGYNYLSMEMTIWDIVRSISLILSHAFTLGILSDPKDSVRHPAAVWTCLSLVLAPALIIIITPTGYTTTTTWLAYFLILIPYFIVFMFISEGPVKRNLFLFMTYSTLFVLLLIISQILAILFADGEESVQIMTRTVMSLLFALAVLWKLKDLFNSATGRITEGWGRLSLFSITVFIIISIFVMTAYLTWDPFLLPFILLVSILVVISYIIALSLLGLLEQKQENQMLNKQKDLLRSELEAENEFVLSARMYRHDMRHHDAIIREYIADGEYEEALKYLDDHAKLIEKTQLQIWSGSKIINAVLRAAERRAEAAGIRFTASVRIPSELPISDTDIGTIFGNLLDNAIEAAENVEPDPYISVRAETRESMLYAEIRNSMSGQTVFTSNNRPRTTKKNGGTGLRSVNTILQENGGGLKLRQSGSEFIAQVIIPLGKN